MTLAEKAIELLDMSLHRPVFVITGSPDDEILGEYMEAAFKDGHRDLLFHRITVESVQQFRSTVLGILNRRFQLKVPSPRSAARVLPLVNELALTRKFILMFPTFEQEMEPMINSLVEYDNIRLIIFSHWEKPTFKRYSRSWKQKFAFIDLENQANIDALIQQ